MIRYLVDTANLITSVGMLLGLASTYLASTSQFSMALTCALLAVLCDVVDGMVARRLRRTSDRMFQEVGVQLDSLADLIHSGIAPAAFVLFYLAATPLAFVLAAVIALAAFWRLAYFNCVGLDQKGRFFGLPVFYSPMLLTGAFLLSGGVGTHAPMLVFAVLVPVLHLTAALRIPKFSGIRLALFFAVLFSEIGVTMARASGAH
jgi:CDP-diacylglycerol---serine O-phosphatidyltransferase